MRAAGINCQPVPRDAEQQRAERRGQHQALVSARAGDAAWSELLHQAQALPGTPLIGMGLENSTRLGKYRTILGWEKRGAGGGFPERMSIPVWHHGRGVQDYTSYVVV